MNSNLNVQFAGIKLKNPFIVASAPPSESVDSILKCAEAGAGAIITKTMADFDSSKLLMGARRSYIKKDLLWAQGTFRHETLTINEGLKLLKKVISETDVPIIASVGFLSLNADEILAVCLEVERAGAAMIHLDLFYIPQPRSDSENIAKLVFILNKLSQNLKIPFGPKFNHDFPPIVASNIVSITKPNALFLLDSHRTPVPIDIYNHGISKMDFLDGAYECSLFGDWQKPITLQYTSVLHRQNSVPICAGGGLSNGDDAIEAIMHGATTTQFATGIIRHGFKFITKTIRQIDEFLDKQGYHDVNLIRGLAQKNIKTDEGEKYTEAKAVVDHNICVKCGKCITIVFCSDILLDDNGLVKIEDTCDGCGLCAAVCPVPGSLQILAL